MHNKGAKYFCRFYGWYPYPLVLL